MITHESGEHPDISDRSCEIWLRLLKLVSLWDMERFYADRFIKVVRTMDYLKGISERGPVALGAEDSELRKGLLNNAQILCKMLMGMGLRVSLCSAEKLEAALGPATEIGRGFSDLVDEINGRIEDEIGLTLCFIINQENARFYNQKEPLFSHFVADRFPDLATDISESGKCYAVGRFTACVFHLMRIMEYGVQRLGVSFTGNEGIIDKDWQNILNDVRGKINAKYPDKKDKDGINHRSLIALLETVKEAWRNPTMHPKQTYTGEEAEEILNSVKGFMRKLAQTT
jgi:hypothetical protein